MVYYGTEANAIKNYKLIIVRPTCLSLHGSVALISVISKLYKIYYAYYCIVCRG